MATEILELQVRATGTAGVKSDLDSIASSGKLAAETMSLLRNTLVLVGAVRIAANFIEFVDQFDEIQNKLVPVTKSTQDLQAVFNGLAAVAQNTAASLSSVTDTYVSLARGTSNLHLNQQQLVDTTQLVIEAVKLSGKTLDQAKTALDQFSVGLGSGALSGRGLTAVIKQLPELAEVIGQKFGVAADGLAAFARNNPGALTTAKVIDAIRESAEKLEEDFSRRAHTINEGFTLVSNAAINFFGRLNQSSGAGEEFFKLLKLIADNMDLVVAAAVGFTALVIVGVTLSNIVVIIGGVVEVLGGLISTITLVIPLFTGLASVILTVGAVILANPIFAGIAAVALLTIAAYTGVFNKSLSDLIPTLDDVKGTFNVMVSFIVASYQTVIEAWDKLPALFGELGIDAANLFIAGLENVVKGALSIANQVAGIFDFSGTIKDRIQAGIDGISFGRFQNNFTGTISALGSTFSKVFTETFNSDPIGHSIDFVQGKIKSALDYLHQFTIGTKGLGVLGGNAPTGGTGGDFIPKADPHAQDKLNALRDALESLIGKVDPYVKAMAEVDKVNADIAKNPELAAQVFAKFGLTVQDVDNRFLRVAADVGNAVTDMQAKFKLLNEAQAKGVLVAGEYEQAMRKINSAAESLIESVNPLIAATAKYNDAQLALANSVRAGFTTQQQMDETLIKIQRDQVGVGNALSDLNQKTLLLNQAFNAGNISLQEYTQQLGKLKIAYLDTQTDAQSGFERGILKVQQEYTDTAKDAEKTITDVFDNLQGTLEDFFKTGRLNFSKLIDGILADLTKLAIKDAITGPLAKLLGGATGTGQGSGDNDLLGGLFNAISGGGQQAADSMSQSISASGNITAGKMGDAFTNQGGSFIQQLIQALSGGSSGGGGGGGLGGLFSSLFGGGGGGGLPDEGFGAGILPGGFAEGGSMIVGGSPGVDKNLLGLRVSRGERVDILTPDQQAKENMRGGRGSAPVIQNFNITTPDADSFRRSQSQIGVMASAGLQRAQKRNG